jgi:hypothetical protein
MNMKKIKLTFCLITLSSLSLFLVLNGTIPLNPQDFLPQTSIGEKEDQLMNLIAEFFDSKQEGTAQDFAQKVRDLLGNNISPTHSKILSFMEQKSKPGIRDLWRLQTIISQDKKLIVALRKRFGDMARPAILKMVNAAVAKRFKA